jgi:hypothetical protein
MVKEIVIIITMILPGSVTYAEEKPMIKPPRAEINYETIEHQPKTLEEGQDEIKNDTKDIKEDPYYALKKAYEKEQIKIIFETD